MRIKLNNFIEYYIRVKLRKQAAIMFLIILSLYNIIKFFNLLTKIQTLRQKTYLLAFTIITITIFVSQSNKYLESKKSIFFVCNLLIVVEDNKDIVAKIKNIVAKNRDKTCSLL